LSLQLKEIAGRVKLTPLALLLALSGVVLIAYVALGVSFVRQHWDKKALSSQVDLANGVLAAAESSGQELEDLQARLQAAEQELARAQSAFPSELDSSAVVETVLAHANASQVRVLRASTKPPAVETEGQTAYSVLSTTFDVEGGLGQLISFLESLESDATGTLGIKSLSLQESAGGYTLNLEVLAYARPADQASGSPTPTPSGAATPTTGGDKDASRNGS
jgi:hypothetical protein